MHDSVELLVFDVNETLSDLSPLGERFSAAGVPAELAGAWFAGVLRDGFAAALAGDNPAFADVGADVLRGLLANAVPGDRLEASVVSVMEGFQALDVHPDVIHGIRALRRGGRRLVTMTNGATSVPEALLSRAGIRDDFEQLLSVADAGVWKPGRRAYEYAASACGVDVADAMLVAVHPWDVHGAKAAGMRAAWIDRSGAPYPRHFTAADVTAGGIDDLALKLGAS